jgi:capsular exopolysaccharide synthesis family protein
MIRLGAPRMADSAVSVPDQTPGAVDSPITVPARNMYPTMVEESFRTLRTNLLLRRDADTRTFVVTSARPGEGKSTIVANLACSLAAMQKRVLLIDADLRQPSVHHFFQVPASPGLVEVLSGVRTGESTWQSTPWGPWILPSGSPSADPQALLELGGVGALMSEARRHFDFVLIDSAPLLAVADTTLIVPHVDAVIFVVRHGAVAEKEASLALDRLAAGKSKVLGCVLSQVTGNEDSFYSYGAKYIQSAADSASGTGRR